MNEPLLIQGIYDWFIQRSIENEFGPAYDRVIKLDGNEGTFYELSFPVDSGLSIEQLGEFITVYLHGVSCGERLGAKKEQARIRNALGVYP